MSKCWKGFNGILSSTILDWDGLSSTFSLERSIDFFTISWQLRESEFLALFHSNCSMDEWVYTGRKNKLKTERRVGGWQGEEDSNTIPKNRLYLLQPCLTGLLCPNPWGLGDLTGIWQIAFSVRSLQYRFKPHKSLSLSAWRPHCSIVQPIAVVGYYAWYICLRKCTEMAEVQKQHREFKVHPNVFSRLKRPCSSANWVKVYPGSWAIFWGHHRNHSDFT